MGISNGVKNLVENLKTEGVLRTPRIIRAFLKNDRKKFTPKAYESEAYVDAPLPIGEGQTISQPYTVAFMIELLGPHPGNRILDIGFGSGWTTGILADIVGARGKVFGLEIVPELFELGAKNLTGFDYKNIALKNGNGWEGLPAEAPFDRILVSAAAASVPLALKEQLAVGGQMVIPIGESVFYGHSVKLIKKLDKNKFEEEDHPGFAFVPLIKK